MANKTVLITGSNRGLGLAFAKYYTNAGWNLLINSAGTFTGRNTMSSTVKSDTAKEFEVHAVGPLLVTRALLPNLKLAAKAGNKTAFVVLMSTIYASIESGGGSYPYYTSKTALHIVNHIMAGELKRDNIGAILLDPGMVYTNMPLSSYEAEAAQVVANMANVIDQATMECTGKMMDYNGTVLPWSKYP